MRSSEPLSKPDDNGAQGVLFEWGVFDKAITSARNMISCDSQPYNVDGAFRIHLLSLCEILTLARTGEVGGELGYGVFISKKKKGSREQKWGDRTDAIRHWEIGWCKSGSNSELGSYFSRRFGW